MPCVREGSATDAWMTGGSSSSLSESTQKPTLCYSDSESISGLSTPRSWLHHPAQNLLASEHQGFHLQNGDQVTLTGPSEPEQLGPLV